MANKELMDTFSWIPVSERLPEIGEYVFVWDSELEGCVAKRNSDDPHAPWKQKQFEGIEPDLYNVTHWIPCKGTAVEQD